MAVHPPVLRRRHHQTGLSLKDLRFVQTGSRWRQRVQQVVKLRKWPQPELAKNALDKPWPATRIMWRRGHQGREPVGSPANTRTYLQQVSAAARRGTWTLGRCSSQTIAEASLPKACVLRFRLQLDRRGAAPSPIWSVAPPGRAGVRQRWLSEQPGQPENPAVAAIDARCWVGRAGCRAARAVEEVRLGTRCHHALLEGQETPRRLLLKSRRGFAMRSGSAIKHPPRSRLLLGI